MGEHARLLAAASATLGAVSLGPKDSRLSPGSAAAIAAVRARAVRERSGAVGRIERVLDGEGLAAEVPALCKGAIGLGRVALNFHPDRLLADGRSVAEALCDEGVYRSQYETGISNGGLSAFPGGDRDEWERRLFGGAYHLHVAAPIERPKYGGLNLGNFTNGPAPAFGSCALLLAEPAADRTTFLFGDSSERHQDMGTADAFEPVLAALFERVAATGQMLGRAGVSVRDLAENLLTGMSLPPGFCRVLDDYIETHTHGPIDLETDADGFLLDPSYRHTPAGARLLQAAERYGLRVAWHTGSTLSLHAFPALAESERGPRRWQTFLASGDAARLATRVITDHSPDREHLTAAAIGAAAAAFQHHPIAWRDWGAPDPNLTPLKDLWRILAAHGAPF